MNNDDFIKIVNDVKSMECIDGRFYRNGWKDACNYILQKLNESNDISIKEKFNMF